MADELDADEKMAINFFAYAVEEAPRKASYRKGGLPPRFYATDY